MASCDSLISLEYINLADVLKDLKYYMYKIRRENGFDLSGPEKPWGEFTATKGGTPYFSYHQDQQLERILDSYARHREGKGYDRIANLLASRPTLLGRMKGPLECSTHDEIEESVRDESTRLILTIAQLLLDENKVFSKTLQCLISTSKNSSDDISVNDKESTRKKRPHGSRRTSSAHHSHKTSHRASEPDGMTFYGYPPSFTVPPPAPVAGTTGQNQKFKSAFPKHYHQSEQELVYAPPVKGISQQPSLRRPMMVGDKSKSSGSGTDQ